jgi:hypothetical protein
MSINRAQLIEIPGGPGTDIGAVVAGDNVEITAEGRLNALPGNVQKIINGTNIAVNPIDGLGNVTITYTGPLPPGDFPPGTNMPFVQAAAPAGWVRQTIGNDAAFRIVNTVGGGTGGSIDFSQTFKSYPFSGTTVLTVSVGGNTDGTGVTPVAGILFSGGCQPTSISGGQMPNHQNAVNQANKNGQGQAQMDTSGPGDLIVQQDRQSDNDGGNQGHNHGIQGNLGFNGTSSSHDHPMSGSQTTSSLAVNGNTINLGVQYVDTIVCLKS